MHLRKCNYHTFKLIYSLPLVHRQKGVLLVYYMVLLCSGVNSVILIRVRLTTPDITSGTFALNAMQQKALGVNIYLRSDTYFLLFFYINVADSDVI